MKHEDGFEIYTDKDGYWKWRFWLKGQIACTSVYGSSHRDMSETAIEELKKAMSKVKLTKKKIKLIKADVIHWKVIAPQKRIYSKIWDWASPYSDGKTTLLDVEQFIANLPNKNMATTSSAGLHRLKQISTKSLKELQKLKQLGEKEAKLKARSYLNNARNKQRW